MAKEPPLVYILHGEDALAINQYVLKMIGKMGEPATAEMNISRLDGRTVTMEELETVTATPPLLSKRRMVVLNYPLARLNNPSSIKKFTRLLERVQPFTALVLVEYKLLTEPKDKRQGKLHWLEKWALEVPDKALIQAFPMPHGMEMSRRVQTIAAAQGATISTSAVEKIISLVGDNPLSIEKEVQKLSAYVNYSRPIVADDVSLLIEDQGQGNIFNMVDAMGNQDSRRALDLLHRQLEENDSSVLFGMMIRQFRFLLLIKEALDDNTVDEVMGRFRIQSFVVERLVQQAKKIDQVVLEKIYHRLLDYDEGMKTSAWAADTALDVIVTEVTQKSYDEL